MPQHLRIEVENILVGRLTTYNKNEGSDTLYDITLCAPELETDLFIPNVETGEPRQPKEPEANRKDFKNDFIHARRCIAAALASATKLLKHLSICKPTGIADTKPITMRLMTNDTDRGLIRVQPNNGQFDVKVTIGGGNNRVENSCPKNKWERSYKGLEVDGGTSQVGRALEIIQSIGQELLGALPKNTKK